MTNSSDSSIEAESLERLLLDAARYRWIRAHGAWETEAFLNGLTPAEYDAAVDKAMAEEPTPAD